MGGDKKHMHGAKRNTNIANIEIRIKFEHFHKSIGYGQFDFYLMKSGFSFFWVVKVSKSQKHFFLKLHCPKNERNIRQNCAVESKKWPTQKYKDILLCWYSSYY